jgi:hypothetical protein
METSSAEVGPSQMISFGPTASARDGEALPLAGELVRIAAERGGVQADLVVRHPMSTTASPDTTGCAFRPADMRIAQRTVPKPRSRLPDVKVSDVRQSTDSTRLLTRRELRQ